MTASQALAESHGLGGPKRYTTLRDALRERRAELEVDSVEATDRRSSAAEIMIVYLLPHADLEEMEPISLGILERYRDGWAVTAPRFTRAGRVPLLEDAAFARLGKVREISIGEQRLLDHYLDGPEDPWTSWDWARLERDAGHTIVHEGRTCVPVPVTLL